MEIKFEKIIQQFALEGELKEVNVYGNGHINDTFKAELKTNGIIQNYILQRINHNVFKNPVGLMRNIEAVTSHLQRKIKDIGGDSTRETLTLVPTKDGNSFIKTDAGSYWRVYIFIENACTYEIVENLGHVFHAGKAFGTFQRLMSDYPPDKLVETIPDFHNTRKRFDTFKKAVARDVKNRCISSQREIKFVTERAGIASILLEKLDKGQIPKRVTHNDTKFNNVMIDQQTGEGICVIDLDTVMPGLSLYDFGDSIRSMANPAQEDERNLSKVNFDIKVFEQYTSGYLESTRDFLSPEEINELPFSAILMTYECGMRFLTDHLEGDTYFKIQRENQNLDRCRTQFKLVQDMEVQFEEMVAIVKKYM
jgi:hypothetical protein